MSATSLCSANAVAFSVFALAFCTASGAAAAGSFKSLDELMTRCGYEVVPLKNGFRNRFYVEAKVNGTRVNCLIDSGASDVLVDAKKAVPLKPLCTRKEARYGGFGKLASEIQEVNIARLELGSSVISNQTAISFDLHKDREVELGTYIARSRRSDEEDVILGRRFFRAVHAILNCGGPTLYLRAEEPDEHMGEVIKESLRLSGFTVVPTGADRYVRGQVNGRDASLVIDTGSVVSCFETSQVAEFGLLDRERLGKMVDLGAHKENLRYAKVPSLKLGEMELKDALVGTAPLDLDKENTALKREGWPPLVGFLGPELLYRCFALIDYSSGKLYVHAPVSKEKGR